MLLMVNLSQLSYQISADTFDSQLGHIKYDDEIETILLPCLSSPDLASLIKITRNQ